MNQIQYMLSIFHDFITTHPLFNFRISCLTLVAPSHRINWIFNLFSLPVFLGNKRRVYEKVSCSQNPHAWRINFQAIIFISLFLLFFMKFHAFWVIFLAMKNKRKRQCFLIKKEKINNDVASYTVASMGSELILI